MKYKLINIDGKIIIMEEISDSFSGVSHYKSICCIKNKEDLKLLNMTIETFIKQAGEE